MSDSKSQEINKKATFIPKNQKPISQPVYIPAPPYGYPPYEYVQPQYPYMYPQPYYQPMTNTYPPQPKTDVKEKPPSENVLKLREQLLAKGVKVQDKNLNIGNPVAAVETKLKTTATEFVPKSVSESTTVIPVVEPVVTPEIKPDVIPPKPEIKPDVIPHPVIKIVETKPEPIKQNPIEEPATVSPLDFKEVSAKGETPTTPLEVSVTEGEEKKVEEIENAIAELHAKYHIYIYPEDILKFFRDSLDEEDIKKGKEKVANYKVFIDRGNKSFKTEYLQLRGPITKSNEANSVLKRAKERFNVKRLKNDNEKFIASLYGSLNKLSEENYEAVTADMLKQEFTSYSQCQKLIELLFDKAVMEKSFCKIYARFCSRLNSESNQLIAKLIHKEFINGVYTILADGCDRREEFTPESTDDKQREIEADEKAFDVFSFRRIILSVCQGEFSKEVKFEELEKHRAALQSKRPKEDSDEYTQWYREYDDLEVEQTTMKMRMLGTVHFIGELYLLKKAKGDKRTLITKQIISKSCFPTLTKDPDDDDKIEALCKLLYTIGSKYLKDDKPGLDQIVDKLREFRDNPNLTTRTRISIIPDFLDFYSKLTESPTTPTTPPTQPAQNSPRFNKQGRSGPTKQKTQDIRATAPSPVSTPTTAHLPVEIPKPTIAEKEKESDEEKKCKSLLLGFWTSYVEENGSNESIVAGFNDLEKTKGTITTLLSTGYDYACIKISGVSSERQLLLFLQLLEILVVGHEKQPRDYTVTPEVISKSLQTYITTEIGNIFEDCPKATEVFAKIVSIYITHEKCTIAQLYDLMKECHDLENNYFTVEILCYTINILKKTPQYLDQNILAAIDLCSITKDTITPIPQQFFKVFSNTELSSVFPQYAEAVHLVQLLEQDKLTEATSFVSSLDTKYMNQYEFVAIFIYGLLHSKKPGFYEKGVNILNQIASKSQQSLCQQHILKSTISSLSSCSADKEYDKILTLWKNNNLISKDSMAVVQGMIRIGKRGAALDLLNSSDFWM